MTTRTPAPPWRSAGGVIDRREGSSEWMSFGSGLVLVAAYVAALLMLMAWTSYDYWGALVVGPILVVVSLPILWRHAQRENDPRLFAFLACILVLHMVMAYLGHVVAFDVYKGVADATGYHKTGVELGEAFRQGVFEPALRRGITGTDFPGFLNGLVYAVFGATRLGGFQFYAWLGFWGLFLFYRAFAIGIPDARPKAYAPLLFLYPSLLFWSSFMGKDPWMVLGLGAASLGAAYILTGRQVPGLAWTGLGVLAMSLVRPHVAGLAGVALAVAYLIRRPKRELGLLGPVAKCVGLAVVAAIALLLVHRTERFLKEAGIETSQGLPGVLTEASAGSAYGGSVFSPSVVSGPKDVPGAAFTVLFRPLFTEADSTLEFVTAAEGTFLMLLTVVRFRWVLAALRSSRRQAYVAFAAAYTGVAIVAFSALANFGLLDRQRVQILPLYFVLLSIPPPEGEAPDIEAPNRGARD